MPSGADAPILLAVPALPFAGFLLNALLGRHLPKRASGILACVAVGLSAVIALSLAVLVSRPQIDGRHLMTADLGTWIPAGTLAVRFRLLLDPLSVLMICLVTGVGFLIHVYSLGYMAEDRSQPRYFAWLNLFVAMMLILVLADNLALTFLGWEGVGLCSYLLIGFWFEDEAKAAAGLKAFLVNRIGDAGFLIGALVCWTALGTLDYAGINAAAPGAGLSHAVLLTITLGLFLGVCGKSAQIPLYVWLPDAMAGPTPVSALIHAATMVTAGVYLLCRMAPVFLLCPFAMHTVAVVGISTSLLAAVVACWQTDIKKVLAYSTVSQLGYMVLACGAGAFTAAMFHLVTHAFFKACLFLGAGSIIHALGGQQDLAKMGALRKALPWTHATFAVSVAAICGMPPLSGFFSKDAILIGVLAGGHPILWALGALGACLTAFYMTRLYALIFWSTDRVGTGLDAHAKAHLHESPGVMTRPLVVLAGLAALGGLLKLFLPGWLSLPGREEVVSPGLEVGAMTGALLLAASGAVFAWNRYSGLAWWGMAPGPSVVDALYRAFIVRPLRRGAGALWFWVDRVLIDGLLVEGPAFVLRALGTALRSAQSGFVSSSLAYLLVGVILLLWLFVGAH